MTQRGGLGTHAQYDIDGNPLDPEAILIFGKVSGTVNSTRQHRSRLTAITCTDNIRARSSNMPDGGVDQDQRSSDV